MAALKKPNRLYNEKSPYLLQHAHNPVDWYPWGPEAFQKARQDNRPILVSIGYSTCHWCHVMERESYENPDVAAVMNKFLVNIKVDREERPDIDKIYMTAVSAMTGQGGWPLNIFLTPDLKPIFGGTYFPPSAKWGQPGWKEVVLQIGQAWQDPQNRSKMEAAAIQITETLRKVTQVSPAAAEGDPAWLDHGLKTLQDTYDAAFGGFSPAPKFPMPVYHNFLLRYYARTKNPEALKMSLHTLRAMAHGGIYDHLGGGFSRYATDENWHVPHFEKMLYDNAQLAINYLEAYQITRDVDLRRVAEETLAYIQRDMTHPLGGFYSAEDADSLPTSETPDKKEGAFYVWEKKEILGILGKEGGERFCAAYGVKTDGNARSDPHGEFIGKNILYVVDPASHDDLKAARKALLDARSMRPRPQLDDKIISGWNGLMLSAFARAYQILGDTSYRESAERAARFLKENLYDAKTQTLARRWRESSLSSFPAATGGEPMGPLPKTAGDDVIAGIADDYAFLVQGLLDIYEADFNSDWLSWAADLTDAQHRRFYDEEHGGYFMTAADQDKHLILRIKEDTDNVEPSASSVTALNLLRLAQYTDRQDYEDLAQQTLKAFGSTMKESPRALPQMLVALDFALTEPRQIVIAGIPEAADTQAMLRVLHDHFVPVKAVMLVDGGPVQSHLAKSQPFLSGLKPINGKATAFVCTRHTCQQPTNDPAMFKDLLKAF